MSSKMEFAAHDIAFYLVHIVRGNLKSADSIPENRIAPTDYINKIFKITFFSIIHHSFILSIKGKARLPKCRGTGSLKQQYVE